MPRVNIDLPESFPFRTLLEVRLSDLNYGGHLGYDRVLTLLQEARLRFFKSLGFAGELGLEGQVGIVVGDATVVYRGEAFAGDELEISICPADLHKYGFSLIYQVIRVADKREIARATTGIICFDYTTRKIAVVPGVLQTRLEL